MSKNGMRDVRGAAKSEREPRVRGMNPVAIACRGKRVTTRQNGGAEVRQKIWRTLPICCR
jgi:hypothetical protein